MAVWHDANPASAAVLLALGAAEYEPTSEAIDNFAGFASAERVSAQVAALQGGLLMAAELFGRRTGGYRLRYRLTASVAMDD